MKQTDCKKKCSAIKKEKEEDKNNKNIINDKNIVKFNMKNARRNKSANQLV